MKALQPRFCALIAPRDGQVEWWGERTVRDVERAVEQDLGEENGFGGGGAEPSKVSGGSTRPNRAGSRTNVAPVEPDGFRCAVVGVARSEWLDVATGAGV